MASSMSACSWSSMSGYMFWLMMKRLLIRPLISILRRLILFKIFKMLGLTALMLLMYAGGTSLRCTASARTSCPTGAWEGGKAAPLEEGTAARTGSCGRTDEDIILTLRRS